MSIQFRLNALIGGLLMLALLSFIATRIGEAGPRIAQENRSIMRLSREFVETSIGSIKAAREPEAALAGLIGGLRDLRHVRIYLDGHAPPQSARRSGGVKRSRVRQWLAGLMAPEPEELRVPVQLSGQHSLGAIVVAAQPSDEIDEVTDEIIELTQRGLLLVLAVFALTSFVIHRALQPLGRLASAMRAMEGGQYDIALPVGGPPEIALISCGLNDLAAGLGRSRSENRWLAQKLVRVEDDERRDLARELHDELGPYLFAVRAGAASLKREAEREGCDQAKMTRLAATMVEQIDNLQQTNRRVLHRLRPVGLAELGLEAALRGVIALLRKEGPDVDVRLALADDLGRLDDTNALTVYRVVQEGLTNAFRHARARAIDVSIARDDPSDRPPGLGARDGLTICVADNGHGISEPLRPGHGLTGMGERIWALGGKLEVLRRPEGGTLLKVWMPVAPAGRE